MHVCMYVYTYVCMYVHMYACMHVYSCHSLKPFKVENLAQNAQVASVIPFPYHSYV